MSLTSHRTIFFHSHLQILLMRECTIFRLKWSRCGNLVCYSRESPNSERSCIKTLDTEHQICMLLLARLWPPATRIKKTKLNRFVAKAFSLYELLFPSAPSMLNEIFNQAAYIYTSIWSNEVLSSPSRYIPLPLVESHSKLYWLWFLSSFWLLWFVMLANFISKNVFHLFHQPPAAVYT